MATRTKRNVVRRGDAPGMRTGALAFIDALGFKGIWRRNDVAKDPTKVLRKLHAIESNLAEDMRYDHEGTIPKRVLDALARSMTVALFSDTVVIAVDEDIGPVKLRHDGIALRSPQMASEMQRAATLTVACNMARNVIRAMAARPAPLAMRGAIAWGEFALRSSFVVGPAVDDAAEAAVLADAALVWLAPSALAHAAILPESSSLPSWPVPMKSGSVFRSRCVSPFDLKMTAAETVRLTRSILKTFGPLRVDIQIKRQNTQLFLERAAQLARVADSRVRSGAGAG